MRAGLAGPLGYSWPQDFSGTPELVVPTLHEPLWPRAAAPPWPPLSVADSTTQWLLLLKQSYFPPISFSSHPVFPCSRSASTLPPPPHGQRTLWEQPGLQWQISAPGSAVQAGSQRCLLCSLPWHRHPCAPALFPSSAVPGKIWDSQTDKRMPVLGILAGMYHQQQHRKLLCSYICANVSKGTFKASCCLWSCQLPVLSFPCSLDSRKSLGVSALEKLF